MLARAVQFRCDCARCNRSGDYLSMRMCQTCPGHLAVVLKYKHVTKPVVLVKIDYPLTVDSYHIGKMLDRHVAHMQVVIRSLDYNLMGADAVHNIENSQSAPADVPLYSQSRKFVRNNTNLPSRLVALSGIA